MKEKRSKRLTTQTWEVGTHRKTQALQQSLPRLSGRELTYFVVLGDADFQDTSPNKPEFSKVLYLELEAVTGRLSLGPGEAC